MHRVTPKVFLVGETKIREGELEDYLRHVGAPEWKTTRCSDSERLVEVMGRLCYRSWGGDGKFNKNVTKVREGNDAYLANIIKTGHGSVIEHAVTNWIFADVSRVFTHELVRHRVGTAFSQESLRFVRLEDLGLWLPPEIEVTPAMRLVFEQAFETAGQLQVELAKALGLDAPGLSFDVKKKLTSAMRRLAPDGLATTIGCSMNFRTLRHLLVMRTSRHAEAEIRLVFDQVGAICLREYPNVFADFARAEVEGCGEWTTPHVKI